MAGLSILNLPTPVRPFRPDRDTRSVDGIVRTERVEAAAAEDERRAESLEGSLQDLAPSDHDIAVDLARQLRRGADDFWGPATPASKLYMRKIQNLVVGNGWPLFEDEALGEAALVGLRPRGMWVSANALSSKWAKAFMKRLYNDFDRSGVTEADGFIIASLHSEYDTRRDGYDFHFHLMAKGDKVLALENLRAMPKYDPGRTEAHEAGMKEAPRVVVQRELYDLPYPLTYNVLQGAHFHRPTTLHPDGAVTRSDFRRQIPNPEYARWLLWMNRQRVQDLVLLSGLRVTRSGFQLTPRKA